MFNRILLASDFSASAEAALLYAAAWARLAQARLLILHVMDSRVVALPHWTDVFRSIEVFAERQAATTAAMHRLRCHPALAGLHIETIVSHGTPRQRLVDAAANVDFVVMGSGSGPARDNSRIFGKVAPYVAHSSPVPVLLVPEGGGTAGLPAAGTTRLPFRHILLAVHFAQYAPPAIELARQLARICDATLQALQVLEPDKIATYPLDAGVGLYHNREAVKILLQKRLASIVPDDPAATPVEHLLLEGNPAAVILEQCTARRADLMVMSAHAYGLLRKFFSVSTIDTVLAQAPCPILAVPMSPPGPPLTTVGTGYASAG
jgi:nucleotide-binding universal stress UspA family protein